MLGQAQIIQCIRFLRKYYRLKLLIPTSRSQRLVSKTHATTAFIVNSLLDIYTFKKKRANVPIIGRLFALCFYVRTLPRPNFRTRLYT